MKASDQILPNVEKRSALSASVSRRRLLLSAVGTTGTLLSGCGRGLGQKTTVRYWNGFTGPDGRTMLRMVQRFNAANPDIQVVMQRMDWATYYNKLFVAGLGGRAPEIFVLQTHSLARFARAKFVRAVDDLTARAGSFPVADLDANVWQSLDFGGAHYGIPLDIWPLGMYYNKRLFREAGVVDANGEPKPPTNRDEFMEAMQTLTRAGQWGFVFTNFESNAYSIMRQFGGAFFSPDYSRCMLNNAENAAALEWCGDIIRKYKYAPSPENFDSWIGFRQGKIAMAFEGIYMLADLQKQKDLDFGGAPLPQVGTTKAVWGGSHNLCIRADVEGKQLDAVWRFIQFLSENSLDWAEGGQVPARRSLRETERFAQMPVQSAFAQQIPHLIYQPRIPFIFEYLTEFNLAVEKALRGRTSPQIALQAAETRINEIIKREAVA
jgi:multiple sugar transport system substrate-binding protein